jgi:hypothetical protein
MRRMSKELDNVDTSKARRSLTIIPPSNSEDSLSVKTKDSIEELSSSVPRSPKSAKSPERTGKATVFMDIPPSPTRSPRSPRRRLTKKLTVSIDGTNFNLEKKAGPLSPFTSGGVLRSKGLLQTAPAAIGDFELSLDEREVSDKLRKAKPEEETKNLRTTSEERSGRKLISFLSRRIGAENIARADANRG